MVPQHTESNDGFMSQKEKDYLQFCFQRNSRQDKTGILYANFLAGEKVSYEFSAKKEVKQVFGKQMRRSRKWQRPSVSSENPFCASDIILADLLGINSLLTSIDLNQEGKTEIEDSAIAYFQQNVSNILPLPKCATFIVGFLKICNLTNREQMLNTIFSNSGLVQSESSYDELLNIQLACNNELRADLSFLWNSACGNIFGSIILKNNLISPRTILASLDTATGMPKYRLNEFITDLWNALSEEERARLDLLCEKFSIPFTNKS